jgi:hypothetical protein
MGLCTSKAVATRPLEAIESSTTKRAEKKSSVSKDPNGTKPLYAAKNSSNGGSIEGAVIQGVAIQGVAIQGASNLGASSPKGLMPKKN